MPRIYDDPRGRPETTDSLRRKGLFLAGIADGLTAKASAQKARISPWRALEIVTESDFNEIVRAIRAGAGSVAVELAPAAPHAEAA